MKKKLVAFAVTAAMVVASAVPALAWEIGGQPSIDLTKNEVIVTPAQSQGIVENINAAITEEGATYEMIVDTNRIAGNSVVDIHLGKGDNAKAGLVKTWVWPDTSRSARVRIGEDYSTEKVVKGIVNLKWTFKAGEVTLVMDELGETERDEITVSSKLVGEFDTVSSVVLSTTGQFVIYQNEAPVDVQSVEVVECDPANNFAVVTGTDGKPVVATQPVAGKAYRVNSVTLDDGTVIGYDDLAKYVTVEWKAMKNGVNQISPIGASDCDLIYDGNGLMISDVKKFEGALVTVTVKGNKVSGIFDTVTWGADAEALATKDRIAGDDRYETAMKVADKMIAKNGKLEYVIVATGTDYADALSATALASKLEAPILLVDGSHEAAVKAYIDENAKSFSNTQIVVLGGTSAVSQSFEDSLYKYKNVTRLEGANRYQTNVAILKAYAGNETAGTGLGATDGAMSQLFVATGNNYADALTAAATARLVLLVGDSIKPVQDTYLKALEDADTVDAIYIAGGTSAVTKSVEKALKSKDYITDTTQVTRLGGTDRYATNKKIVETFFKVGGKYSAGSANVVYVASGNGYADALTGGVLAATNSQYGAPLVLVSESNTKVAKNIVSNIKTDIGEAAFDRFIVIGGENAVSNEVVQKIA